MKPNTRTRTETALRATRHNHPLHPNATPATGDILTVCGHKFTLVEIVSAGGRAADDFRIYRFRDDRNRIVDIPSSALGH